MGNLKDKKGFTLVELLAVIVILGIVTVIGVTTILPYMQNAQKDAFVDEANYVIDAATHAVTLINIKTITEPASASSDYKHDNDNYCFSLKFLVEKGLWTKDAKQIGASSSTNGLYSGKVLAQKQENGGYTYKVFMTNGKYWIASSEGGQITNSNVTTAAPTGFSVACNAS